MEWFVVWWALISVTVMIERATRDPFDAEIEARTP